MRVFVVDAFAAGPGTGNPAAVCPIDGPAFPPAHVLQRLAAQHNLSETAFYHPLDTAPGAFALRWFTPEQEVDLCGHATLAAAFVALVLDKLRGGAATFHTKSGALTVRLLEDGSLELDFPSRPPAPVPAAAVPPALFEALGLPSSAARFVGKARDYLVVVDTEAQVRALRPDHGKLAAIDALCVVVSARGEGGFDVVSRVFCPACGVPEDPVTGSAHCTIVPYFCELLGKRELRCAQVGARGGELRAVLREGGQRVAMAGRASLYLRGEIEAAALAE